ncbi:MAG: hypothetical protein JO029_12675 [Candidatus Eremiobacteraeota bacterium]|nr:hypothetical protein [Candidatus Eremiobacteraeota bacterium]MBV8655252.1 hypothetical protein [Candidatus Eremiobacteraeota bacterium]
MPSDAGVLGDLIEWFLGRSGDRRQYKRRAGSFHLWWQSGSGEKPEMRPGIGIELSPNGLMFLSPDKIGTAEYNLVVRIADKKMPVRVRHVRSDVVTHQGRSWNRYMGEFVGIAADNWDVICRYVNQEDEPKDRRKMQNQEMAKQPDDAYRLLPMAIQQKIVEMLVAKGRLERPHGGQTPLLKLFYGGLINRPGKKPAHRVNVHSRISVKDELVAYDTRFLVEDDGTVTFA